MRDRLWGIIITELSGTGLGIADGCEDALNDQIQRIVGNVRRDGWKRPQRDIEDDFRRLIRSMIDSARTKNYHELHEDTFQDGLFAANIFCPGFWPFC